MSTLGKAPGFERSPDHKVTIRPAGSRWQVTAGDMVLADSTHALILEEAGYGPVVYFPRDDVRLEMFEPSDRKTTCPFKGEASYFTLPGGDPLAWTYPETYAEVGEIAGHIAFYPQLVEIRPVE